MNKKGYILVISLVLIMLFCLSTVSAKDTDLNANTLEKSNDVTILNEGDSNVSQIHSQHTVKVGSDSDSIQNTIDCMNDGDILNFETGTYKDICIYVNKSITINGNGAELIGYDTPSKSNTPEIIYNDTGKGGYAIGNFATLYIVKADNVVINGLKITGGANSTSTYSNALIYAMNSKNLTFKSNVLEGSSWGLYFQYCTDGHVTNNIIKNQAVTGFLNFGSARTSIENNKVINAKNHGIDVRHGTGPNVKIINNTVIGSKEGIYLMHSTGHVAANNTLINCTISSISCYGSKNIKLNGNKMQKSRIGVLLGGGYENITVGENMFTLDNLPYPPTFAYYIAEAKSEYQNDEDIMGTFSDSSLYTPNFVAFTGIDVPKDIGINYDPILEKTGPEWIVPEGASSSEIQNMINNMNNGDTLSFTQNAIYNEISIYTDKNIKILGNNATLVGCSGINFNNTHYLDNVAEKVRKSTNEGGYAIGYNAVLYILNTTNVVVSDLNIKAQYPKYDSSKVETTTNEYKTVGIYADSNSGLVITGCDVTGASWGIFQQYCKNSTIIRNNIHDIYTTGIMNFGSPNGIIAGNTVTDAANHGIDVRHGTGPNVTIFNNTISGAKEGIYLMHSKGHSAYNNTILNCKISGITAYGSGNEVLFNNTISGSRLGILLGGGYYNITIGKNTFKLDSLPFPPTFVTYLARADNKYQSEDDVIRTYSDKETAAVDANDITVGYKKGEFNITLIGQNGDKLSYEDLSISINGANFTAKTDEKGIAVIPLSLTTGIYNMTIKFAGNDNYAPINVTKTVTVNDDRIKTILSATSKTLYLTIISKGYSYKVTFKDMNGKAIANKKISFKIDGKTYSATTSSTGIANIKIKATTTGNKKATISFKGDDKYAPVTKTLTVKVIKQSSKISAYKKTFKVKIKTKKYTITLKNNKGKAIYKGTVYIKVKGKTYKAVTNSKGKATFKITKLTKKGKFTATIKYYGNKYYSSTSKQVLIRTRR
ncbi:parallel beta-helix repeat (two copies) [Methanobrevibacter gottschalkii]|uniref:Parallel beta-helix repeat protein n=3 Tax=Methanobacteriaceae TaxID=2159 RepID=A0A3N5BY84_9EURY|nr:hypothetical protein A9505_02785 [Methanobrevibacter sp. A27]RPF50805.1 parallel beta-helix repeat protein [Methanobrevibacter gottschalkii DSM 11977]SEK47658.1 parallel beta-helix repeat (two copies) [Methanobrevibacter gottschalkii]